MATAVKLELSGATTEKKYAYVDANGVVSWSKETSVTGSTQIASLENDTLTLATDHSKYNIAVSGGTGYTADTTIAGLAAKDSVDAAGFNATVSTGVAGVSYTNVDDSDSIVLADEDSVTFASTAKADTKVTLPASATKGITVGTKTYKTGTAGTKLTVAKSGTVTLGTANDEVTIDGVKYVATTGESITIDSEGNAVAPVNTKVTITTAEEGATAVAYEATTGTITVAKTGVATIEAGEAAKVGDVAYASTSGTITVDKTGVATLDKGDDAKVATTEYKVTSGSITVSKDGLTVASMSTDAAYTSGDTPVTAPDVLKKATGAPEDAVLSADGVLSFTVDSKMYTQQGALSSNTDYYTASVTVGTKTYNYATAKNDGNAVVDLGSATADYLVSIPGGSKGADSVVTGRGADTIYAASYDTVNAGAGADTIVLDGKYGVTVEKNQNTGNDSVKGFVMGFATTEGAEADIVKLDNASGLSKTNLDDGVLTLYTSSTKNASTQLQAATAADVTDYSAKIRIAVGDESVKNYQFVADNNGTYQTIDKDAQVVYGADSVGSGLLLNSKTTDESPITVVNLSGINNAKIGDTRTYGNIRDIAAADSTTDNVLVTSGTMNSSIEAGTGKSSIWGGVSTVSGATAANDLFTLHATNGVKDHGVATIFTGTANGKDTVVNYDGANGDLVYAYDNKLTSLTEDVDQGYITLGFQDGTELSLSTTQKASTTGNTSAGATDSDTTLNMYATAWGASVKAQVGTYMTAQDDTAIYYATRSATIKVTDDLTTDKLWLYKEVTKDGYTNAKVNGRNSDLIIDASSRNTDINLAGTSGNDTILAGNGTNALFGGAGTDALYGNASGQTTFYFGKDLAANTTVYVENKADKVVLYNVTESDIKSATYDDNAGSLTLTTNDGSTLTINKASTIDKTVSLSGTDYQFSSTGNALQKKA